jgi:hypothetical protein
MHVGRLGLLLLTLWTLGSSAGCATPARFPAAGQIAGQRVDTTVDSPVARYYLERYLEGDRSDGALVQAIQGALAEGPAEPHDREGLGRLARRLSTDLATLHFVARLYERPANRRAQDAFHANLRRLAASRSAGEGAPPGDRKAHVLAFVPGYAYRKDPTTGADFARQRIILNETGFRTLLIETEELGSVERNAALVAAGLTRLAEREDRIIVVSTSKGGPEVALALGEGISPETSRRVKAWISVGGLLRGSRYADRYLGWPRRWLAAIALAWEGLPASVVSDMSTAVRAPVFDRLTIPAHILTLQYVGAPLSGQVPPWTLGRYTVLQPYGPNDGLTLLSDELVAGGIVVTDLGLDHYYQDLAIDLKTIALTYVVLDELRRRETPARDEPSTPAVAESLPGLALGRIVWIGVDGGSRRRTGGPTDD